MSRAAKSLAADPDVPISGIRLSDWLHREAHNGCARTALLVLGVEKRAVAIERCKRAPNVLNADFGQAQLGINQTWRKSTGDIVSSKR